MRGLCFVMAACLWGQGTEVRKSAAEYPAQASLAKAELGADLMVHSVTWRGQSVVAGDYLVVEVGVFPRDKHAVDVRAGQFGLRLNGKKAVLPPAWAGAVAASIKYPDWEQRGRMEASAGIGDSGVVLGRPPAVGRFPGDPTVPRRLPRPETPGVGSDAGVRKEEAMPPEEILAGAALVEGETRYPVRGYLYFPWKGKMKGLKSVELVYEGPAGSGVARLK